MLVYVVGKCGRNKLLQCHHTKQYVEDFPLIEKLVESFTVRYTTPNVLTEVSNLGKKIGVEFFDQLKTVVQVLDECYCSSKDATLHSQFRKLGLTDSALLHLGPQFLIVTADFPLYMTLRSKGFPAVNFSHLRQF